MSKDGMICATDLRHPMGSISYPEFLETYLKPNRPVILPRRIIEPCPAFRLWVTTGNQGTTHHESIPNPASIDWAYLSEHFGDHEVSVSDCTKVDCFGNLECTTVRFSDVVAKWARGEGQSLYVKDWHLARSVETQEMTSPSGTESGAFYSTPDVFKDDWMNAYYTTNTNDDFRFVYVGAAGTFTPLHRDVYCSYSWSTNVCGRKRWWLFPPDQTAYLFMGGRRLTVHDVRAVDGSKFLQFCKTTPFVVEQDEGETIFVPSGWYHQVENLTDCISINHNWCNSVNLAPLYASMCDKVEEVEQALDDVREMLKSSATDDEGWQREFTGVVQDLVKHDAGWNWLIFWSMVAHALNAIVVAPGSSMKDDVQIALYPDSSIPSMESSVPRQLVFPPAPASLRPSQDFIRDQVRCCYKDFISRNRFECERETKAVVETVASLLTDGTRTNDKV